MELARLLHALELALDLGDAFLDHAPVGFDLRLARSAEEAEAAALTFEMRPGAHQPALLIGQVRMLDLQRAFARASAASEDFQNQPGAIEHLRAPGFFKIALLHRRERAVHHDDADVLAFHEPGELLDLAFAEIGRGPDFAERRNARLDDVEIDRARKTDRLVKPRFRGSFVRVRARRNTTQRPTPQIRPDDHRTAG